MNKLNFVLKYPGVLCGRPDTYQYALVCVISTLLQELDLV